MLFSISTPSPISAPKNLFYKQRLTPVHTVPQLAAFTETLVERSSQYFTVTVVFGPAMDTVVNVFPKLCSRYYMQSRSLLQNENKCPISNKRPVPISALFQ